MKWTRPFCNHEHLPSNIYVFWVRRYAKTVRDVKILKIYLDSHDSEVFPDYKMNEAICSHERLLYIIGINDFQPWRAAPNLALKRPFILHILQKNSWEGGFSLST